MREAARHISKTPGIRLIKQSALMETKPMGPIQNQPDFLNSVIEVKTTLSAIELLDALLAIERGLGIGGL